MDKMKIALLHKKYTSYGGTERFMTNLTACLLDEGHEVTVYANDWVPPYDERINFIKVPMIKGLKLFKVISFAYFAERTVKPELYDIVHGFGKSIRQDIYRTGGGCHKAWQKESLLSIKSILLRNLRYFGRMISPIQWLNLYIEKKMFTAGNYLRIISPSKKVKSQIMELYGVPDQDIAVIYNGVDLTKFNLDCADEIRRSKRAEYGIKDDETLLVFAATNFELKGLEFIIRAVGQLKDRNLKLLVVGGDRQKKYRELAHRLGVSNKVVFSGASSMISEQYKCGDIFIYPTFYDPFANTCLEAMACGLPVITSRANGVAEIIDDGESGLIINDPSDSGEIADKIKLMLDDEALREKIRTRSIQLSQKYTKENNTQSIIKIYKELRRLK